MTAIVQHQDHALLFLCSHSLEEAKHYGLDLSFVLDPRSSSAGGEIGLNTDTESLATDTLNTDAAALVTIKGQHITLSYTEQGKKGSFTGNYTRVTCMC